MITKEELVYRQIITLPDGGRVLLRLLTPDDRQALIDLYAPVTKDDLRYMRHEVTDAGIVNKWVDELNYDRVLPLVATIGGRIVGNATLHFFEGPARHRTEVRIFLAKEIRRRGVGARMLKALVELGRRRSLHMIEAQIISDQTTVIKAFQKLGFELKTVLDDYFILPAKPLQRHGIHIGCMPSAMLNKNWMMEEQPNLGLCGLGIVAPLSWYHDNESLVSIRQPGKFPPDLG